MKAMIPIVAALWAFRCLAQVTTFPTNLVVPNSLGNVEGNSAFGDPFLPYIGVISTNYDVRFQQVYSGSEFVRLIPNGGWIYGISLRANIPPDGTPSAGFEGDLPDLQINFSTTSRDPDGLSAVYSENVGLDDQIVFGRGPLTNFRIDNFFTGGIPFSRPFFFNPTAGNLLMDVRTYAGIPLPFQPPIPAMDAQNTLGDSISIVSGDLDNATGTIRTGGLVTQFLVTPVPRLSVSLVSSNLLFRWENLRDGSQLQRSSLLGPGALWQLTGGAVQTNGAYKEVTLPLDTNAAADFFRLVLPTPTRAANTSKASPQIANSH